MDYTIFSVEDNEDISHLIQVALSKQGYLVEIFPNGATFLEALKKKTPNMVLLDLMLPDIQGTELLQYMRQKPQYDEVEIIIVSAKSAIMDRIDGLDLGADDYLGKPFDILELMSRVNAKVRRFRMNRIIHISPYTLDRDRQTLFHHEQEITLTNKEFKILELLMVSKGKVVNRDTMISTLWGGDVILETRTIDMHIRSLRNKLDEGFILTIHGVGYKVRL